MIGCINLNIVQNISATSNIGNIIPNFRKVHTMYCTDLG
ncbi:hypothetical protein BMW23_0899 [Bodo saltans virus]|uniref:Uncharacterized protein n=1 Tax=Bodo saltans virus TaxID=2024608 RepID=A0A2H4UVT1_9VIRU|nr:hypothetical protein QJ851_gp0882 [Bodo saltans virus]ATZ80945.1 hypothetical protein BMW23_0899 [Bodo saltans virus]